MCTDTVSRSSSKLLHCLWILEQVLQNCPKARGAGRALVAEPRFADCLEVFRSVVHHDAPTERHRFQEGWMGATDLGGFHEAVRIAGQLAVARAEEIACEHHSRVGRRAQLIDVVGSIGSVADDYTPEVGREPAKGLDEVMSAVLGNQSAHEQDVPAGDEPVLREVSAWCCGHGFGAI